MPIASVVADANVLLSTAVGKAALRVFTKFTVRVHVTQFNADEVAEYLPYMASKYELPIELVDMQWKLLPLQIHRTDKYHSQLPQAIADLKDRDPGDAYALALARSLTVPLWSNDRDLRGLDVECYPTARLLRLLAEEADLLPSVLTRESKLTPADSARDWLAAPPPRRSSSAAARTRHSQF